MRTLVLGALGVVYGDIGTSPLYALRESLAHSNIRVGADEFELAVLGILSLVFWSLIIVVTLKYLSVIMRADNHGEGGILALMALAMPKSGQRRSSILIVAGLFGAALLYSDGALTPAISVLSAVEGIGVATEGGLDRFVMPITIVVLIGIFMVQKRGTSGVGAVFGPLMIVWFVAIALAGAPWIVGNPEVLKAMNPYYAMHFFATHGSTAFWALSSVVLCITGGEALYADMGHFGRNPIKYAWYGLVLPALLINYFGQGALLLSSTSHVEHPFYQLVPPSMLYPMVGVATVATVIASQALISGAFSLTRAAIQLGYLPRLEIRHTSSETAGQIYVPEVNRALALACLVLVWSFKESSNLAAAYGMAVTGTMTITTILFFFIARQWWGKWKAGLLCGAFLVVDLAFLTANTDKLVHGGWVPLAMAAGIFIVMTTWKAGRQRLADYMCTAAIPLDEFLDELGEKEPQRVEGTAVFMTSSPTGTPPVLFHHYKHNRVLHRQVVLLSIVSEDVPHVPRSERVKVDWLYQGFYRVTAHYGFMQTPRMSDILRACSRFGLEARETETSFYLGRESLVIGEQPGLARWRKTLFRLLSKNARPATDFFRIPPDRVVELGMHIEL